MLPIMVNTAILTVGGACAVVIVALHRGGQGQLVRSDHQRRQIFITGADEIRRGTSRSSEPVPPFHASLRPGSGMNRRVHATGRIARLRGRIVSTFPRRLAWKLFRCQTWSPARDRSQCRGLASRLCGVPRKRSGSMPRFKPS